jgi:branched-chain amino acid transport system substrate-binding protein
MAILALALSVGSARATEFNVASMQSLTGPAAFIGVAVNDGTKFGIDEINKNNFLGAGNTIKLAVADDAGDRTQTLTIVGKFAADSNMLAIIGPTTGTAAMAGASAANGGMIPSLQTSNNADALKAGPWAFIGTQPAWITIPYIGSYAVDTLKVKNCVVIGAGDNENYVILTRTLVEYFKTHGVNVVDEESVKLADSDFSAIATKVVAMNNVDCLFISNPGPQTANIVRQLRQAGLDPKIRILGHNSLASPAFVTTGGAAVEGVYLIADWAPGGTTDMGRAFEKNFTAATGHAPDNWNAVGYGFAYVMAAAIKNAGPNPTREAVRTALTKTKDVPVVVGQGLYSIDADRIPHYGMAVLQIKDGKFVLAPK